MSESEWVTVGGKNKPRKRDQQAALSNAKAKPGQEDENNDDMPGWDLGGKSSRRETNQRGNRRGKGKQQTSNWQREALGDARNEVADSRMYTNLLAAFQSMEQWPGGEDANADTCRGLSTMRELVVYGLGSLEAGNVTPRYQLGLALLLAERHLLNLARPMQLFDPVFTEGDQALLTSLGCEVIGVDEEGARAVGGTPTFFYLPHCEAKLCNSLLAANWSQEQLSNVIILGNSFQTIAGRWEFGSTAPIGQKAPERVLSLVQQGLVVEVNVSDAGFPVPSAFNDMSLHFFPACKLAAVDQGFWDPKP